MATLMKKTSKSLWASWLIVFLAVSISHAALPVGDSARNGKGGPASYRISAVNWEQPPGENVLRIKGASAPTYTMYELFEPLRVIIDIADASLEPSVTLPLDLSSGPVSRVNGKVLGDKKPSITRMELFLNDDHEYTVERTDNDIVVRFPLRQQDQPTGVTNATAGATGAKTATMVDASTPAGTAVDMPALSASTQATKVTNIEVEKSPSETKIYLKADGPIRNYKKVLLDKNPAANRPNRMYLDLSKLRLARPFETRPVNTSALDKLRTAKRQDGFRIVFDSALNRMFDYSISEQPDGLLVTITEPFATAQKPAETPQMTAPTGAALDMPGQGNERASKTTDAPGESIIAATGLETEAEPTKPSLASSTVIDETAILDSENTTVKKFKAPTPSEITFAGYNKQRITVDFYKIDLHNVFRLFGEISNLNMVVDEAVNGSLTLALNDVPWDFALDIILNLKDLQKEERFNTIVISPKSKSFTWPERALDNVEFKSDIKIQQAEGDQGGLKISKRLEVPEHVVEAKKLVHQAHTAERKGDFAAAISLYEEAFGKWNDNANLAKRIAALCLVNLEQNAKAVHYAKAALSLDPEDGDAALQAAIGLARMKKTSEAKEFFDLSVAGEKPSSEALSSYSSFCEEQMDYNCSLSQLKRHEGLHGDSLDNMVSKARIYDKQGKPDLASLEYRTILLSGYELPTDLARYVKGRAALAGR